MKATMRIAKLLLSITTVCALVIASAISLGGANPPQTATQAVPIDGDDLGGVVRSAKGPEAGVWVIAETTGLRTKFAKIAVTDDQGRYVVPDLPKVNYNVWVRGYGLVDSERCRRLLAKSSTSRPSSHQTLPRPPSTIPPVIGSR